MRKITTIAFIVAVVAVLTASQAFADVANVRCVLWQGDASKHHTAISGQSVRLAGVIDTTNTFPTWYKWVYGDGSESGVGGLSGNTRYEVSIDHAYSGAVGTPFTARLLVDPVDATMANAVSDTYLVKIEENNLDARVNIAIDKGLWWLYTNDYTHSYQHTFNGSDFMAWLQTSYGSFFSSPTASALQAFAINNHKINGDQNEDPYVEAVRKAMNWIVSGYYYSSSYPTLRVLGVDTASDANGNGVGIEVRDYSYRPIYEGGQVMDAIIASGVQPGDDTGRDFSGRGYNWTYGELLQDMCDMYAYGQSELGSYTGGWRYNWNADADNSACQWAAIGMIPAQKAPWNCTVPAWVKTKNASWLTYSHYAWTSSGLQFGGFGYTGPSYGYGTSPSGLVQMAFDGQIGYDDPVTPIDERDVKWVRTERYFAHYWGSFLSSNNTYGWYAFAKAMRLAIPKQVERLVHNGLDWYKGSGSTQGLAGRIVDTQISSGYWDGNYTDRPLTTAWMIIVLRPALFKAAPIACFTAHPNPSYADHPIIFDPTCSDHSETGKDIDNLIKFEWDWDNDGTYDEFTTDPDEVTHSFSCASLPCTYPVTLRVTDDDPEALTATFTLDIVISNPPHPPVADAGGPYMTSLCAGDTLTLDGSGSYDPNEGEHEAGCGSCPDDTITAWDWDFYGAPFDYTDGSGETVNPVYTAAGVYNVGLRVADNTELSFPSSGDPDLTDEDFTTVSVYDGCICDLAARPKRTKIQLTWSHTGAASYDIYRSTVGASGPFVLIANGHVTNYATYLDADVTLTSGNTYYYRVTTSDGCGSNSASATLTSR